MIGQRAHVIDGASLDRPTHRVRSPQWLRVAYAASSFIGFGVGGFLLSLTVLPVAWLAGGPLESRRRRCQRCVAWAFRAFLGYMRTCGLVDASPLTPAPQSRGPRVVVANHPTLIDVTVIVAAEPELCCVVKPEVSRNPLFTLLIWLCGHIRAASPDGLGAGVRVVDDALARLAAGHSVLIFPEGTRSPDDGVGPFQRGAFEIAIRAGVPVQPALLRAHPPLLKRGTPWYGIPRMNASLRIEWLPLIESHLEPEGLSSRVVAADTEQTYTDRLGGTP